MSISQSVELAPATGEQRRRAAFLLDDYVDTGARILELGPGDGWLGAYLIHSGFRGYRRLHTDPAADLAGSIERWRELGLAPASIDFIVAFDVLQSIDCLSECFELLVPGGYLFLIVPDPNRARLAALLERLRLRRAPALPATRVERLNDLRGFRRVSSRRRNLVERWAVLRKPLEPQPGRSGS